MADELEIASKAIKQIQDLRAELVKLSQDVQTVNKNTINISTPSGLSKSNNDNAKASAELDALKAKYISLNETIVKKAEQSRLAEIRLQQQREKSFDSFERNAQKEEAALKKAEGAYQRIQNSVNVLTKAYNDLSIRKQLGNTLSASEEKQLTSLSARINTYQTALKNTDAQIGKNQRNVGNYASGYNALGNSINQLTREAPAFANSVQTGFMAISNNIAAFQDAIMGLRKSGVSWGGIMKEMGTSLFGLTGMISLATTLLVTLGPQFIDWLFNTNAEKEALDRLTASLKKQNDQVKIYNENLAHQNVIAVENAKQRGASTREIQGLERKLAEDQLKNLEDNRDLRKKEYDEFVLNEAKKIAISFKGTKWYDTQVELVRKRLLKQNSIQKNAFIESENEVKRQGKVLSELVEKQQTQLVTESNKKDKASVKLKKEKTEALNLEGVAIGTTIEQLDKYIDMLETELILNTGNETAYKNIKTALDQVKQSKTDLMTGGGEIISTANLKEASTAIEDVKTQLSDLQKNYLKSFVDEFAGNSGFSETFKMLNDEIDGFGENFAVTFNAIAESAQEAFNFISGISQQNFDAEKERLQSQYEVSLVYAGDNKAAQEKLAEDLEKQKQQIANREAKAKQKQAIFNIAIDTAQAVVAAIAKSPLTLGMPWAAIIAGIGALQIGLVASQKIPQYWMGGTHEGGLMMVNDGKGSNFQETIVTPDGKIMQPKGRNVIMDAPKGTEIYTQDQWNNTLQEMLQGKGISMSNNVVNSGGGATANQIDSIMGKHFSKIALNNVAFDENGMRVWSERNGNKTISTANRVSRRGKIV